MKRERGERYGRKIKGGREDQNNWAIVPIHVAFWGPAALDLMIDGYTLAKDAKIRIIARAEVGIVARRIGAFAAVKDALTA